jgi:hypothetical protein
MTPIINPWLFYLADCLAKLQIMCILVVSALVTVIIFLTFRINDLEYKEKELKSARRTRKIVIFFSILLFIVIPFIPSKETCYKMMIASQITDNNIQKAEDVIKNSVDYIFEKINE